MRTTIAMDNILHIAGLFVVGIAYASGTNIPPHVLDNLMHRKTAADMAKYIFVNSTESLRRGSDFSVFAGSIIGQDTHPMRSWEGSDPSVIHIADPVQAEDHCVLLHVCVPVQFDRQPGRFVFPACVQLPQCVGACCNSDQRCHAQRVQKVGITAVEYEYRGEDPRTGQPIFRHLANHNHLECGCRSCDVDAPTSCRAPKELRNCDCKCPQTTGDEQACPGGQHWNTETCRCECFVYSCGPNQNFDTFSCRCESSFRRSTPGNVGNSAGNIGHFGRWLRRRLSNLLA